MTSRTGTSAATGGGGTLDGVYYTTGLTYQGQPQQQQAASSSANVLGPGVARILNSQAQYNVYDGGEEEMRRRTRLSYAALGVLLLSVYLILWHSHVFPFHHNSSSKQKHPSESNSNIKHEISDSSLEDLPQLWGSSKKSKNPCEDGNYSKRTLKRAYELPFAGLFQDTKGQKKYEASSIILEGGNAYAICDNSWSIYKFGDSLTPFAPGNQLIGDPERPNEDDSGYEALFYDEHFYVMRESVLHDATQTYHAIIEELDLDGPQDDGSSYTVLDTCSSEFEFEGDSKGFEGAIYFRDTNNDLIVLGLCEGNHCSQTKKFDVGHGAFVAMKKTAASGDAPCQWSTIAKIHIPSSAKFRDYSAATIDAKGRVAISSQEDSALWIGQLLGQDETTGLWDLDKLEFDSKVGDVYDFPKNDNCETVYCNIEGIHWINEQMLIAVSDKMKSKGKQDFQCFEKDQSVHVFVLP